LFSDNCIFIHDECGVIIAAYVDDLLLFGKTLIKVYEIKELLSHELETKDMGEIKYFLGIQVYGDQTARTIRINQAADIDKIIHRFGMGDSKSTRTPIAPGTQLGKASDSDQPAHQFQYQSMVESLMYGMHCTGPDLAYAIQ
jgi:Reverse transcriptase (RNA-dependent DNA polymerase)